jgi:hypothetical protein
MTATYLVGDTRTRTAQLPDNSVDLVCDECGDPIPNGLEPCYPDTRIIHPWCCPICKDD